METSGTYLIEVAQETVWAALNDPEVLQKCIPGCESLSQIDDTSFNALVVAKIGPVKAKFKTSVMLENIAAPNSYTLTGSSKAAAGFGKGKADVTLKTVEQGTELNFIADFKVGGKLAQVGSRLIDGATKKTADEFFSNLSDYLNTSDSSSSETVETTASAADVLEEAHLGARPKWVYLTGVVIAALLLWFAFSD